MITRLEVDGFKSFSRFAVDVPPFVAIVGPNASGKSNIFDALAFLSRAVATPLAEALAKGRGEPEEQFRRTGDDVPVNRMSFAVELLLEREVRDDFGSSPSLPHTRLRYELVVELRPDVRGHVRPMVAEERIRPITKSKDRMKSWVSREFAEAHLVYGASQWKILETEDLPDSGRMFLLKGVRGDKPQGRLTQVPATRASSSVLTSVTTAIEFPLLFAVRQEIEHWRFLQLEPAAVRQPSVVGSPDDHLLNDGANLAWVLELISQANQSSGAPGLDAVATDLARVIRGFSRVSVRANEARGQWEVYLTTRDEGRVSARVASDGTLRLLALLAALYEPDQPGVLCFEEPENGINPQRLTAMVNVLRELVSDPRPAGRGRSEGLVQLLMSSHSPLLPLRLNSGEILVVDTVNLIERSGGPASRVTRARRIVGESEQYALDDVQNEGWLPLSVRSQMDLPGISADDAQKIVDAQ